jgi:hypothetical protein
MILKNQTRTRFTLIAMAWTGLFLHAMIAAEPQPAAEAKTFDSITFLSSGGITGKGSGKWLLLTADGKLEAKNGNGQAKKVVQLEKKNVEEIHKIAAAVKWATIEKLYQSRGADMFYDCLTIVIAGKEYQTRGDESAKLPPELKNLFSQLDVFYRQAIKE